MLMAYLEDTLKLWFIFFYISPIINYIMTVDQL